MGAFRSEADGGKLKPANYKMEISEEQQLEIARCIVDPIYFIENYCYVVHPAKGRMLLKLFEFQKRIIRAYVNHDRLITMAPRQTGKCFTINTCLTTRFCGNDSTITTEMVGDFYARLKEKMRARAVEQPEVRPVLYSGLASEVHRSQSGRLGRVQDLWTSIWEFDTSSQHEVWGADAPNLRGAVQEGSRTSFLAKILGQDLRGSLGRIGRGAASEIGTSEGREESLERSWGQVLSLLEAWKELRSIYGDEGSHDEEAERHPTDLDRVLHEARGRGPRSRRADAIGASADVHPGEVRGQAWSRGGDSRVQRPTASLEQELQEEQLLEGQSGALQGDHGAPLRGRVLRGTRSPGHGGLCEQGAQAPVIERTFHDAGLCGRGTEEDHRVRRDLLASQRFCEQGTSRGKRSTTQGRRLAGPQGARDRLLEEPILGRGRVPLLSETVERKFVEVVPLEGYEVWTDTGWQPMSSVQITVPYEVWTIKTLSGKQLECADDHILFDGSFCEIFAKDCLPGSIVVTEDGPEMVCSLERSGRFENMFDVSVDSRDHRLYTNGFLSHNSTTAAAFLLWTACFKEDQKILVASNKGRGAQEIMERFRFMYEECPWFLKPGLAVWNVMSVKFDNNSFVEGTTTTENTGRGLSLSLLYLDEFAKVRPNIQQAFYTSTLPTLSTGGDLIITSTPDTDEDSFAKIWFSAEDFDDSYPWTDELMSETEQEVEAYETVYEADLLASEAKAAAGDVDEEINYGFKRVFVDWREHPDRDDTFKRKMLRQGFTETDWVREFECGFASADMTLIEPIRLLKLNAGVRKPRFVDRHGMEWFEEIRPNAVHAIVIDPSEGVGRDQAVVQVWSIPDLRQVAEWASTRADQIEQTRMLIRTMKRIYDTQSSDPDHLGDPEIYYSVESNGLGIGIINAIMLEGEEKFPGYLIDAESNANGRGLRTTSTTKLQFVMQLKKLIERGLFKPRSKQLVSELKDFVRRGRGYEAKQGAKDDRVMSCVLMLHMLDELKYQVDDLEESMHVQLAHEERDPDDHDDGDEDVPLLPVF